MKSRDPFKYNTEEPIPVSWKHDRFLEFDQSGKNKQYEQDPAEVLRKPFNYKALLVVTFLVLGIFVVRLIDLEIIKGDEYRAVAEGNSLRQQNILAPRGIIYDSFGVQLAYSEPSFDLVVTPLDLPRDEEAFKKAIENVSRFFSIEVNELLEIVDPISRDSFLPILVKPQIDKELAVAFIATESLYPGFSIQNSPQRTYKDGPIFAHALGYTGKLTAGEYEDLGDEGYLFNDKIGKNGLELIYENDLRGSFGQRLVEVDASGLVKKTFRERPPSPGSDLHLNIDYELQKVLYESLNKQMSLSKASKAAAIAIDPRTGGVLALISFPSFDNNLFAKGIDLETFRGISENPDLPLFNRVVSGTYPPGSTIKPFLGAAALQEGVIGLDTRINDTGQLAVPNQFNPEMVHIFRGWNPNGLGNVNVYDAIAVSSDIFFYTVGGGQEILGIDGLGPQKMADYLTKFFLGRTLGIDLPSEKTGLIPTPDWKAQRFADDDIEKLWFLGDTYNMSIGQGFSLATPLQIAVATAAIANGGTVYKPKIVEQVTDADGKVTAEFEPEVLATDFLEASHIHAAQIGMRQAVTDGTARALAFLPIEIAGKTGTSQFDGSDLSRTHAWFTSYAPYNNPKIALTILIEAGGEGSGVAVPVAADLYRWYAENRK